VDVTPPSGFDAFAIFEFYKKPPDYKDASVATSYRHELAYPDYKNVKIVILPWLLGSGNPCRNDAI